MYSLRLVKDKKKFAALVVLEDMSQLEADSLTANLCNLAKSSLLLGRNRKPVSWGDEKDPDILRQSRLKSM
jgi:hypothetical protein